MKHHETELFYAKVFAAKALQLTANLSVEEIKQVYSYVMKTAQKVSYVNFHGFQQITNCVRTDYAERSSGRGLNLTGLISFSINESEQQHAHRETTCSNEVISQSISELALDSVDLMLVDELIREQDKKLQLKILKESEASEYPTWGSPDFIN